MTVKGAMSINLKKINSTATVTAAAKYMHEKNVGSLLIEDNDKILGIMTERDILSKVAAQGKHSDEVLVSEIMSTNLFTIDHNAPLEEAGELMRKHKVRRISVTDNDKIVGIITARDVAERMKFSIAKRLSDYGRATEFR